MGEAGDARPLPAFVDVSVPAGADERLQSFLAWLGRMSREERIRASRYSFKSWQLHAWAARYPEEVPLVNGEYEFIALKLADLD